MIKVNWSKIKPFEKKPFALGAMGGLALIGIVLLVLAAIANGPIVLLKLVSCVLITASVGLLIHIESRMLQIYMLQCVFDVLMAISCIKTKGIVGIILGAVLCVGVLVSIIATHKLVTKDSMYDCPETDRSEFFGGKNVLMFAPHEDDEINIYGGIIEQYVKYGSTVRVVFSTNGDVYGIGKLRIKEALDVAREYGVPEENFIFLGYSDSMRGASGKHIYNCPADESVASVKGYTEAYGIDSHNSYSNKPFTRQNVLDDFTDVINEFKPDVLYCCDYDSHPDHRAIGLFFEEALDSILKTDITYRPTVYKGFAYSLAWMGKLDYYSPNSRSTHQWIVDEMMVENNAYRWDERLRLPVANETLSHVMQNASSYVAMMKYSSQTATDHANGILNNDKVFWERRTDSLLLTAQIAATSGDASHIAEFKLCDSEDINNQELLPAANAWVADEEDEAPAVMFRLEKPMPISQINIYESPYKLNHIVKATLKVGKHQISLDKMQKGANKYVFDPIVTDVLAIRLDEYTGNASLLKVEAFSTPDSNETQIAKLVNSRDDFCYDYMIKPRGTENFTIYQYPANDEQLQVSASGDIEIVKNVHDITINCKKGCEGIVTITSADGSKIFDQIRISNPDETTRKQITKQQSIEPRLWTLPMQKDYYVGLVRRLGVYR